MNRPGWDLRHFLIKRRIDLAKREFKLMLRDISVKVADWLFICQKAILAFSPLCVDFKNRFGQMTFLIMYLSIMKKLQGLSSQTVIK